MEKVKEGTEGRGFEVVMEARDYECDAAGRVNNANYMHYFEHTRHLMLRERGLSFKGLLEKGVETVVARAELAFKAPLRGGERFRSRLKVEKEGWRYVFRQELRGAEDDRLICRARIDVVCLVGGRLSECPELGRALGLGDEGEGETTKR